jgi:alkylation response protein AidB-like acyl-CoA dehydrogenase
MKIARSFADELAERSAEFEDQGYISQDLVDRIAETGLYRLCNPAEQGGLGGSPKDYAEVVEYLAQFDSASAWVLFIGITSSLSMGNLPDSEIKAILADKAAMTAGVFAPMGRAIPAEQDGVQGFRLSGQWQWGSGSRNCKYLSGGGFVTDADGNIQTNAHNIPDQRSFVLDRNAVELVDTWHVSGLKGTGSGDFKVTDQFVPENRVFNAMMSNGADSSIFKFPTFGFLGIGIAAVALGMARACLDEIVAIAVAKTPQGSKRALATRASAHIAVAKAEAQLRSARLFFYDAIGHAWQGALDGEKPSLEVRGNLRLALTHTVQSCATLITDLYTLAGGSSVYLKSPMQRYFRDIHVVTQHMMVNEATLEMVGRVLLKQDVKAVQL